MRGWLVGWLVGCGWVGWVGSRNMCKMLVQVGEVFFGGSPDPVG